MKMLFIAFFCLALLACKAEHGLPLPLNTNSTSNKNITNVIETPLKGYNSWEKSLVQRILAPDWAMLFKLSYPLGGTYSKSPLANLLGFYRFRSAKSEFVNGQPHSVNILLFHLIFNQISKDLALYCDASKPKTFPYSLNTIFKERLLNLCQWPLPEDKANSILMEYWLALMAYDAPFYEYDQWKNHALSEEMQTKSAEEAVWSLNMLIFQSPHFILKAE